MAFVDCQRAVWGAGQGKVSAPLLTTAQNPLIFNALKVPKALHFSPVAAHPVTGLFPPLLIGAIEAIFGPVGFGDKQGTTNSAWPHLVTVEQGGAQVCVQ